MKPWVCGSTFWPATRILRLQMWVCFEKGGFRLIEALTPAVKKRGLSSYQRNFCFWGGFLNYSMSCPQNPVLLVEAPRLFPSPLPRSTGIDKAGRITIRVFRPNDLYHGSIGILFCWFGVVDAQGVLSLVCGWGWGIIAVLCVWDFGLESALSSFRFDAQQLIFVGLLLVGYCLSLCRAKS